MVSTGEGEWEGSSYSIGGRPHGASADCPNYPRELLPTGCRRPRGRPQPGPDPKPPAASAVCSPSAARPHVMPSPSAAVDAPPKPKFSLALFGHRRRQKLPPADAKPPASAAQVELPPLAAAPGHIHSGHIHSGVHSAAAGPVHLSTPSSAPVAGVFPRRSASRASALPVLAVDDADDADEGHSFNFRHTTPGARRPKRQPPPRGALLRASSGGNGTVFVLPARGLRRSRLSSSSSTSSSSHSESLGLGPLAADAGDEAEDAADRGVPMLEDELDAWWTARPELAALEDLAVVIAPSFEPVDELRPRVAGPADLAPDPRACCAPRSVRAGLRSARALERQLVFAIRATKWGAFLLVLARRGLRTGRLDAAACVSVRFAVCAAVRSEVDGRRARQAQLERRMAKKMTEYRVAVECVAGARGVLKFGRKGRPHATQLAVDNGETLRWTPKPRRAVGALGRSLPLPGTGPSKARGIALAAVLQVREGVATDVLARAVHKGTLAGDARSRACALSVVTRARTLDITAKSPEEREWLVRSLRFLVQLAREHERRVAQQAELAIMRRMEGVEVLKHGRRGRPHKTRLLVNRFGEISWLGRSNDAIQLDEIRAIAVGLETPVFARAVAAGRAQRADAFASRCFSLVTRARSLDIEAASEAQRDWFVVAFRYLLDKVHEKTAALQREKAEKQLRLLQELCGNGPNNTGGHEFHGDGERIQPAPAPPSRYM